MAKHKKIGVLFVSEADKSQLAMMTIHESGVLIYSSIRKGMHPYSLKPVESYLRENYLNEPLYKKHEKFMDSNNELPEDILWSEAEKLAKVFDNADVQISGESFIAIPVHFEVDEE